MCTPFCAIRPDLPHTKIQRFYHFCLPTTHVLSAGYTPLTHRTKGGARYRGCRSLLLWLVGKPHPSPQAGLCFGVSKTARFFFVPPRTDLELRTQLQVTRKSYLTLQGRSPVLGTRYLEFEWFVPITGLRFKKGYVDTW